MYSAVVDMVSQLASWEIHIVDLGLTDTDIVVDIGLLIKTGFSYDDMV